MSEPNYTIQTDKLSGWTLAVYLCNGCEREFYDDAGSNSEPVSCPYCEAEL